MKTLKIFQILIIIIIIISIPFTLYILINKYKSYEQNTEIYIKFEGKITNKIIIFNRCYNKYFLILNETIKIQVNRCIFDTFEINEYIYITNINTISKNGKDFYFFICDDFGHCILGLTIFEILIIMIIIIIISIIIYFLPNKKINTNHISNYR